MIFRINYWRFQFRRDIDYTSDFFNIFLYVFCNLKLQLKLSDEKLKDSILFNFFAAFVSTINADAGDDSNKIDHVPCIDVGMIADMRGLFGC